MNKLTTLLLLAAASWTPASAQTQMTKEQALNYYTYRQPSRVTVHDPSVVWDAESKQYYIFGSHRAQARTSDLQNWQAVTPPVPWGRVSASGGIQQVTNAVAFSVPQVRKVVKRGVEHDFPAFDAKAWAAQTTDGYSVDGNIWAPDVIYNPVMKKWCQYLSINGDKWASSIILLTADRIDGPYVYQGPVVISGFNGTNTNNYKDTDLEIVLGTQASLPVRYSKGGAWGTTWPNNIDPCVFYDEHGKLWMAYGSWSGGIFMLELDEKTGLRDYDVTYPLVGSGANYTCDPYFGKKIAGGYYVSGEAPYIRRIGKYYYLFVTYGGLESNGGYMMEVFRSERPDGPYTDLRGTGAIFSGYVMNYGTGGAYRGAKLLGSYGDWGFMTKGTSAELAQGHNSAITDEQGRGFLVYHTRFNNGTEGHQIRVHQLFSNRDGWLVAAPFEFSGEATTDAIIASGQVFGAAQVAGTYEILIHKQLLDHKNKEVVKPVKIRLNEDGTVSGTYTGAWSLVPETSYINITLGGSTYRGVVVEQQMEPYTIKAIAFSGINTQGVSLWGYKMKHDYALAYTVNRLMPLKDGDVVSASVDLTGFADDNVKVEWSSSNPAVLSPAGVYNAAAMTEETMPVDLTVTLKSGGYVFSDVIHVTVRKTDADYTSGAMALYPFDAAPLLNSYNTAQGATLKRNGNASVPVLVSDGERNTKVLRTAFGASGNESYAEMVNPLKEQTLADGFTVSFMVDREDDNLWDALFSFYTPASGARLYITGNTYVGYNSNTGNWVDLNHASVRTGNIEIGKWTMVTMTISRTGGVKLYLNGTEKAFPMTNGQQNGVGVSSPGGFAFGEVIDFVRSSPRMYLGYGSFWGSAKAKYDNLMVYDRVLSAADVAALYAAENSGQDLTGIEAVRLAPCAADTDAIYNLSGRKVAISPNGLPHGIYIRTGRKFVVR